jgi:hypothetical protein
LSLIVHRMITAAFNKTARRGIPYVGDDRQRFEFITWLTILIFHPLIYTQIPKEISKAYPRTSSYLAKPFRVGLFDSAESAFAHVCRHCSLQWTFLS